jgi:REP element-mobilizing transposase RayT
MARSKRVTPGGFVYHVFNRGSRKGVLFDSCEDYDAFVERMDHARRRQPVRIIAYSLMKNHVHFLLWPHTSTAIPQFMKWLTGTHAGNFHRQRGTIGLGAVYQSRYRCVPIFDDHRLLTAWRYVERNALEGGFVDRADAWPWCSAWQGDDMHQPFEVDEGPIPRPATWVEMLNDF